MRRLIALTAAAALTACAAPETEDHDHDNEALSGEQLAAWDRAHVAKENPKQDGCNGVTVPDQGDFGGQIALTFDDGPSSATTPQILETLRKHAAPATFFVVGRRVDEEAALIKEIQADPDFILANHSWSHPDHAKLAIDKAGAQMDDTNDAVAAVTGEQMKYFRFPYGSSTCGTSAAVADRDMIMTGWHVDSADWCYEAGNGYCKPSTFRHVPDQYRESMSSYVMSQVARKNGGIVLFHDTKKNTAAELDALLTTLTEAGFTFVHLNDEAVFPMLHGQQPAETVFVGDACEADEVCDFSNAGREGFCLNGYCSAPCAGFCPDLTGKAPTFCVADPTADAVGGVCVSQSSARNEYCVARPGTVEKALDRFVGDSGAAPRSADVCLPIEN